jgi:hypothetical protein
MIQIKLKDKRLSSRWELMVRCHMRVASPLAAGVSGLPDGNLKTSFAATQATWRFLNNDRVTFGELVVPLQDFARTACTSISAPFVLLAHDWSKLSYPGHKSREDLAELSSSSDVGYELACALAINPDDGLPIAPLEMHLKTAAGMLSTRGKVEVAGHTDQVMATMNASASWNLGKPIVHVIDREADSVGHYRDWTEAGHKFLVRGDDRRVLYQDKKVKLSDVRRQLQDQGGFQSVGTVLHNNRPVDMEISEAEVTLYRPARKSVKKVRTDVPGVQKEGTLGHTAPGGPLGHTAPAGSPVGPKVWQRDRPPNNQKEGSLPLGHTAPAGSPVGPKVWQRDPPPIIKKKALCPLVTPPPSASCRWGDD